MKIGVSTAIFWDYESLDLPGAIVHSVEGLGFEAVEIHCEDPLFKGWGTGRAEITKKEVGDTLSILDVEISLHAPYHDLNMASLNSRVREEVMRQHEECIGTARYLDSEVLTVHPGFVSSRKYKREMAFQRMTENLAEICRMAEDSGITICLENLALKRKAMCVEISELKRAIDEIGPENIKLTLDVAHANTTEQGPLKYARELKEHIRHVHLSDNVGEDEHLALGQGNIDFADILEELKPYDGFLIVEGWVPKEEDPFLRIGKKKLEGILEELRQ